MVAKDFIKVLALYDFLKVFSFLSQINSPVKGLIDFIHLLSLSLRRRIFMVKVLYLYMHMHGHTIHGNSYTHLLLPLISLSLSLPLSSLPKSSVFATN